MLSITLINILLLSFILYKTNLLISWEGHLWSWLHGIWIYNYLCNQCLSPLTLWVRIQLWARSTRYNIMWLNLSVTCDRSVHGFLWVLTNKNDWNIVESGVKHHNQTNILDTNSRTYVLRFVNPRFHSLTLRCSSKSCLYKCFIF